MAGVDKVDYAREFKNFELAKWVLEQDGGKLTQEEYAYQIGVNPAGLSTHFAELRRKEEDAEIVQNLRAISRLATNKVSKGIASLQMETVKDAEGIARIGYGAADRIGFSPQAATINIQNSNTQQTLVIPPMFAGEETQEIKNLIGDF